MTQRVAATQYVAVTGRMQRPVTASRPAAQACRADAAD